MVPWIMENERYQEFTRLLAASLESRDGVLALIALGSMAGTVTTPDRWSDHDFFVIVRDGLEERFRQELDWLPFSGDITFWFRETEHGLKVLYQDGHLLEFAVFTVGQLSLAKVNSYRVLLGGPPFENMMADLACSSTDWAMGQKSDETKTLGLFLCNLVVGVGRYRRGEVLSGHLFVKSYALAHALRLIADAVPAEAGARLDNLDPARRFERGFPRATARLQEALVLSVPEAARALVETVRDERAEAGRELPATAVAAVLGFLDAIS